MNEQGKFYEMAHECPCGSGLLCEWYKDERGEDARACGRCRGELLFRIFDSRYLDLFEEWWVDLFKDPPPLGYEWQWEDLLKEKGCEQVVGAEEARRRKGDRIMIPCPNGDSLSPEHWQSEDNSVHIMVPAEYAERTLKEGRMP